MEQKIIALGIETFKLSLYLALPSLFIGMVVGLLVSIFQATTQINEMTLSFIPKIVAIVFILVITMPWMINITIDFTTRVFEMIPDFIQ